MSNSELIAQTLENEAEAADRAEESAKDFAIEAKGGRTALTKATENVRGLVAAIEADIMSDEKMNTEAKDRAIYHASRTLRRVAESISSLAHAKNSEIQMAIGRQTLASDMAKGMRTRAAQIRNVAEERARQRAKDEAKAKASKAKKAKAPKAKAKTPAKAPKK